jgi:isocitrate dehydrogenase (NADP) (EC 1.1.1.42)
MAKIKVEDGKLIVPDEVDIPFIEGDGTGPDISRAAKIVFEAAVKKAYGGKRKVNWIEALAGESAFKKVGKWLPEETIQLIKEHIIAIKGPLTTPVGGGIRSINVTLRQIFDLYACVRPVKYFKGVPSPLKYPDKVDSIVFRENTEDVYMGIEWKYDSEEAKKNKKLFKRRIRDIFERRFRNRNKTNI